MNCTYFVVIFFCCILQSICRDQCPAIYLRYSTEHSYCKAKNSSCKIYQSGVTPEQKVQILDLHNKYRNCVAMGKEKQAGGLPEASDMIEMVWDSELEAVAQKTAEQCIYKHDCSNCREVENFAVGQNIAYHEERCSEKCLNFVADWNHVIKRFYDEVAIFDKKYVKSMVFSPGKVYGHFTQIVWSKTWRIGCGFVAFEKGNGYRQLYFCNYGPSGNIPNHPLYTAGTPCSACPINSYCGSLCGNDTTYEGLCRMNQTNVSTLYRRPEDYIFYCDFHNLTGDCNVSVNVANKWKHIKALGGPYVEAVLSNNETSTITFNSMLKPQQIFCLVLRYRAGPTVDGQNSSYSAFAELEKPNEYKSHISLPKPPNKSFFNYHITWNWGSFNSKFDSKVLITFFVPEGYPEQYFNLQLVAAKNGVCLQQI